MASDDHPSKKEVAAGEKAALEEGEIPEDEDEEEIQHPPPSPTPVVDIPPVKKLKGINVVVGSASTTAGGSASGDGPPPPPAPQAQQPPPVAPGQVPCPLCNRVFDSYPAMFGHQRVHKERTYRGAYPPPTFNREGSPPTAEETEEAARVAAQMLLDISKGQWEKQEAEQRDAASSSARGGVSVDLNIPLESDEETEKEEVEGKVPANLDLNKSPPKDEE